MRKDVDMSKRQTDTLAPEAEVPMGAMDTGAARPGHSGRAIGLAVAALALAFSVGFLVVWSQDTEQAAQVVPKAVIEQEDPRLKYEFEGGTPVAERGPYLSTSGNPLE
jgi:hypothetical protein